MVGGFVQAETALQEQPVFDNEGHLIYYRYSDGTRDLYAYDTSWRMCSFTARDGKTSRFVYLEDGSMTTMKPDRK